MDVVVPGRLAESLQLEERVGGRRRRHHPVATRRAARSATCSAVKPNSFITRAAGAEAPKRSSVTTSPRGPDPAMPAERHAGLDREPRACIGGGRTLRRGTPRSAPRTAPSTASTRAARGRPARASSSSARDDECELGAGGDQEDVGTVDVGVEDVGAAPQALGGGEAAAVERRHVLARERERRRAGGGCSIATRHAQTVSLASPGRMKSRSRDRAQRGVVLDRLVRRAVLADADAVVRVDPDRCRAGRARRAGPRGRM